MKGGSDHIDSLEHTPISEAAYRQQDLSNYPSFPLMKDNLKLSNFSPTDLSSNNHISEKPGILIDLKPQLGFDSQQEYSSHLMQEALNNPHMPLQQPNWAASFNGVQEMEFNIHNQQQEQHHQHHDLYQQLQYKLQCFNSTSCAEPTPELLNLLHLPGCSATTMLPGTSVNILGDMSMAQSIPASMDTVPYTQLNFSSEPPVFRELFQTLHHNFNIPGSRASSCFNGTDFRDANEGLVQEEDGLHIENSVPNLRRGRAKVKGKQTEKQRRGQFNEKYNALRSLLPNPTKPDRASTIASTIEYIHELQRTVNELKMLVKKKKIQRARSKRLKMEDGMAPADTESSMLKPLEGGEQSFNEPMRSSWLIRKYKETVIDVRIIEDEVNIKLTQRRKGNCLLLVSKVLDELQMELLHATGGNIGDYNIFMFNTKICEGSSVYANAIAQELIEVLERQHLISL